MPIPDSHFVKASVVRSPSPLIYPFLPFLCFLPHFFPSSACLASLISRLRRCRCAFLRQPTTNQVDFLSLSSPPLTSVSHCRSCFPRVIINPGVVMPRQNRQNRQNPRQGTTDALASSIKKAAKQSSSHDICNTYEDTTNPTTPTESPRWKNRQSSSHRQNYRLISKGRASP